ncbi:hypothetical protein BUALT_Bualt13G0011900 [Buddleja alternifolia]|uniref:Peptidase A1 domain-containing protein n=1 Tax=Buddleja alternifolia TaxID=168488 RepID=A0AAV6WKL7_9LAMI|nr:hypothetical protein BUALT_Bualt13G0011900 [Buddleja alternifolia]
MSQSTETPPFATVYSQNSISAVSDHPDLVDNFALSSTTKPGRPRPGSKLVFACTVPVADSKIYRGLARGSAGLAALGRFNYSIPAQVSRSFSTPLIFSLCLPSSSEASGLALFNSPRIDLSKSLIYTPLITAPIGSDTQVYIVSQSPEYYIGLTAIKVNGKSIPLNRSLLAITELGHGGVKISTSRAYSVLHTSVFNALRDAFVKESSKLNLTLIEPLEPFKVCYVAEKMEITRGGPAVPIIDLVLQSERLFWRIYRSNSMVRVRIGNVDAWCLGFVDGGDDPRTSIIIGGHQFEDNLLEFDFIGKLIYYYY